MRSTNESSNCPYCLSPIESREEAIRCPKCGVMHHAECWKSNGRCSVYGCDGWAIWNRQISDRIAPPAAGRIVIAPTDLTDESDQPLRCIKCGRPVKRNQITCAHCRFTARDNRFLENCLGPAVVVFSIGASGIFFLIRLLI